MERFNPKTFKPFDKVLVRDEANGCWAPYPLCEFAPDVPIPVYVLICAGSNVSLTTKKPSIFLAQEKIVQNIINGGRNRYENVDSKELR